jgi:hypothetical protein
MEMFTIPLEQINYEKIEAFCKEQIAEGETIEYKSDFPSDLEKSISAMANTYGGIILIGVKADKIRNVPILPIEGRDLVEGLEEKVISICLRKIYQPYFPLVKVCPLPNEKGENKCVVFIRVYESNQTPHAINNNSEVYFRIKSQNEPFRKATLDEIEWLKDRRKKAIELRETILIRAEERYNNLCSPHLSVSDKDRFRSCWVVPLYCNRQIVEYYDLFLTLDKLKGFGFDRQIDNLKNIGKTGNDVLCYHKVTSDELTKNKCVHYGEFNIYGLVIRKESLWEDTNKDFRSHFAIESFLEQIYQTLKLGLLFYSALGYNGMLKVNAVTRGLRNRHVISINETFTNIEEHITYNEIENEFSYNDDFLTMELSENFDLIISEIYRRFLFACGLGKDKNNLDSLCSKHYSLVKERHKY